MDKILKSLELYLDDKIATQTEIDRFILFIQKLKSSTAGKHKHIVDKQVFKLKREDAIEFDFDLSEWRDNYNAIYLQATKS